MHGTFTDEQREFRAAVREFCERECGTRAQRDALTHEGAVQHNDELYRQMAELGWVGAGLPEEYGGGGAGIVEECIVMEEAMRGRAPIQGVGTSLIVAGAYLRFGTEEQKARVLGGIARGDVYSIAMSEPEAGSDVGNLSCRAPRENGGYRINGQKTWISNAQDAELILLVARENPDAGKHGGMTMLEIPSGTAGVEIHPIATMAGKHELNDVYFTDTVVPASAVLGQPEQAWMQLMAGLNPERLYAGALALGMAWNAFDIALAYVKEREQYGRPIGSFQAIRHRLARHATELEATSALIYQVARQVAAQPDALFPREASMVKLKACELAKEVSLDAMHMMGGYGYTLEYDIESLVRQTIILPVPGGASEVQLDIISKTYGL